MVRVSQVRVRQVSQVRVSQVSQVTQTLSFFTKHEKCPTLTGMKVL